MFLYGAGGHAKVVRDLLESCGMSISGICDDNPQKEKWMEFEVKKEVDLKDDVIVCIGNPNQRKEVVEMLESKGVTFGTAIHNKAIMSSHAKLGEGSVVMAGTVVNGDSEIGKHCIINTGAVVEHECKLGDYVHISPHATLCGELTIGEGTWIGAGAVVIQGVKIGKWCIIGAGSLVLNDIPDGVVAYGSPCKVMKSIGEDENEKYEKTYKSNNI